MRIIKTTLVAGLIAIFATFSSFAEKVKMDLVVDALAVLTIANFVLFILFVLGE